MTVTKGFLLSLNGVLIKLEQENKVQRPISDMQA